MAQSIAKLEVSEQQRQELLLVLRASSSSQRDVRRAHIVLLRAEGKSQHEAMGFYEGWGTVVDQMVEYMKSLK